MAVCDTILWLYVEDHIGNKCAIVCFNVSIPGKYYMLISLFAYALNNVFNIIMFYQINSLTLTHYCIVVVDIERPVHGASPQQRGPWGACAAGVWHHQ